MALLSHSEALVATNFGRIYRLLLHVEDDDKQVAGTLLFEEPGVCFTCMGLGASTHVWAGCADGRALTLGVHGGRSRWVEAFRQCRVSAAFGANAGHGLLADHAGSVQLWLHDASESAPSRLAEVKLVSSKKGDKNQRLLCAELLTDDPAWLLGDEHGNLHLVNLRNRSHRAVHEGKVLCLKLLSQKDREFLSAGADGTVVHHRIESEVWTQLSSHRPGCGLRHLAHLSMMPRSGTSDVSIPPLLIGAFQSADFVLWDAVAGLEIWRRRCGGAKRPNDLLADGASYTFVFSSASKSLEIHSTFTPEAGVRNCIFRYRTAEAPSFTIWMPSSIASIPRAIPIISIIVVT